MVPQQVALAPGYGLGPTMSATHLPLAGLPLVQLSHRRLGPQNGACSCPVRSGSWDPFGFLLERKGRECKNGYLVILVLSNEVTLTGWEAGISVLVQQMRNVKLRYTDLTNSAGVP